MANRPYEIMVEQAEARAEEESRTPAEQAEFDKMLQEYSDREAELEEKFTFDGFGVPWGQVKKAVSWTHNARESLRPRCWSNRPERPVPEWRTQAVDKIDHARRLLMDAQKLLEDNAS